MFISIITLLIAYILLFLLSIRLKDNSIADVFWGVGFIILSISTFFSGEKGVPQILLTLLILLWGVRISVHIGKRKWNERREDPRYAKWREEWGSGWYFYVRSFLQVYMLQMLLMIVVAIPIFVVNGIVIPADAGIHVSIAGFRDKPGMIEQLFLIIGGMIALFGLAFETLADRQLEAFIKIKKPGEIFTSGLYRYSRHPNYFGESMFWLGISFLAFPYSILGFIGWGTITFLLLFVSGVPLQEARYAGRPNWEEYKRKTSVFIPWFPKKTK